MKKKITKGLLIAIAASGICMTGCASGQSEHSLEGQESLQAEEQQVSISEISVPEEVKGLEIKEMPDKITIADVDGTEDGKFIDSSSAESSGLEWLNYLRALEYGNDKTDSEILLPDEHVRALARKHQMDAYILHYYPDVEINEESFFLSDLGGTAPESTTYTVRCIIGDSVYTFVNDGKHIYDSYADADSYVQAEKELEDLIKSKFKTEFDSLKKASGIHKDDVRLFIESDTGRIGDFKHIKGDLWFPESAVESLGFDFEAFEQFIKTTGYSGTFQICKKVYDDPEDPESWGHWDELYEFEF